MTRRRIAALFVTLSSLALAASAPRFVERRLESFAATRGVDAEVRLGWQSLELTNVRATLGGHRIECDRVETRPRFAESLRSRAPRLYTAHAHACTVSDDEAASGRGAENGQGGATRWNEVHARLANPGFVVDAASVDTVHATTRLRGRTLRGSISDITALGIGGPGPSVSLRYRGDEPLLLDVEIDARLTDEGVSLTPSGAVELAGCVLRVERVELGVDESVTVARLEAACWDIPTIVVDSTGLDATGAVWADGIALDDAQFRALAAWAEIDLPAAATPGAPEPSTASADQATEPTGRDRQAPPPYLSNALAAAGGLIEVHDRFRARVAALTESVATPVRLSNISLDGFAGCRDLELRSADLIAGDVNGLVACDGQSLRVEIPSDPSSAIVIALEGVAARNMADSVQGELDVELRVTRSEAGLNAQGEMTARSFGFFHAAISAEPITDVNAVARASVSLSLDPAGRALVQFEWRATLGAVAIDGNGSATPESDAWVVRAEGGVSEPTPCADLFDAIPRGMVSDLADADVVLAGSAAPRLRASYASGNTDSFDMRQSGFMGDCSVISIDAPYDPRALASDDFVFTVTSGVDAPLSVGPGTSDYVPLDELPSFVAALMYLSEEVGFFDNPGFSMMLMRRAVRMNLREGRYVYGGSTVSQQLVKNLFFTRDKTLARKLEEAIVVWAMESVIDKERILELYVNCIEFAPNVYGIAAAARHYYGVEASELTPLEAAFIAALKPAPWRGDWHRRQGHSPNNGWWHDRVRLLLERLVEYGPYIDPSEVDHYAPYVVVFPTSPAGADSGIARIARPKGAIAESFRAARARLFGP